MVQRLGFRVEEVQEVRDFKHTVLQVKYVMLTLLRGSRRHTGGSVSFQQGAQCQVHSASPHAGQ